MFYDYLITLEDERALIWRRKWSGSTLLFLINRYVMLFTIMVYLIPETAHVSSLCVVFVSEADICRRE